MSKLFTCLFTFFYVFQLEKMRLRAENSEKEAMLLEVQLGDLRDQLNEVNSTC